MVFRVYLFLTVATDGFHGTSGWISALVFYPGACVVFQQQQQQQQRCNSLRTGGHLQRTNSTENATR